MNKLWNFLAIVFLIFSGIRNIEAQIDNGLPQVSKPNSTKVSSSPLIVELRRRIEILDLDSYFTSDKQLARYLESTNFNIDRADGMLIRTAQWRKSTGVDKILDWTPSSFLFKSFPYERTGFTNDGNPVIYLPIGKWNLRAVREAGQGSEIYKYMIRMLEDIRKSLIGLTNPKTGEIVDQVVIVENLEGFDLTNFLTVRDSHLLNVYNYFKNIDMHYPFFAKRYIALRSPLALHAAWKLFRITTPRLRQWLHTYNNFFSIRGQLELFHFVPKEAIPVELGGSYVSLVSSSFRGGVVSSLDPEKTGIVVAALGR